MDTYAVDVVLRIRVHVPADDAREAEQKVRADDIWWMEPVTQGDVPVDITNVTRVVSE